MGSHSGSQATPCDHLQYPQPQRQNRQAPQEGWISTNISNRKDSDSSRKTWTTFSINFASSSQLCSRHIRTLTNFPKHPSSIIPALCIFLLYTKTTMTMWPHSDEKVTWDPTDRSPFSIPVRFTFSTRPTTVTMLSTFTQKEIYRMQRHSQGLGPCGGEH